MNCSPKICGRRIVATLGFGDLLSKYPEERLGGALGFGDLGEEFHWPLDFLHTRFRDPLAPEFYSSFNASFWSRYTCFEGAGTRDSLQVAWQLRRLLAQPNRRDPPLRFRHRVKKVGNKRAPGIRPQPVNTAKPQFRP